MRVSISCTLAEPGKLVKNGTANNVSINDFACNHTQWDEKRRSIELGEQIRDLFKAAGVEEIDKGSTSLAMHTNTSDIRQAHLGVGAFECIHARK